MIRSSPELERFEREYARSRRGRTYGEALAVFEALWVEAAALNPDFPSRIWRTDIAGDVELARVLNGVPGGA